MIKNVEMKQEGVNLYFGVPAGKNIGKIEQYKYHISKNIAKYMQASQNTNQKIKEKDSITIHIDAEKEYKIGDYGTFDGGKVYVRKKIIHMNKGILRYQYELADRNGLTCSKEFNNKMEQDYISRKPGSSILCSNMLYCRRVSGNNVI